MVLDLKPLKEKSRLSNSAHSPESYAIKSWEINVFNDADVAGKIEDRGEGNTWFTVYS